jgi:RNA polymerase sigma factor (TIGR02999 family)
MPELGLPVQPLPPDAAAAIDEFFRGSYEDLQRIARSRLRRSESVTLLDTTSLVHECYLRFLRSGQAGLKNDAEFAAYASTIMRTVIVDFIRRRRAESRGSGEAHVTLDTEVADTVQAHEDEILDVSEALATLSAIEPRLAQVVEMRYFGGLTEPQIAQLLGVGERTVRRDWNKARVLLRAAMGR